MHSDGKKWELQSYILDVTKYGYHDKSAGWKTWKLKNK